MGWGLYAGAGITLTGAYPQDLPWLVSARCGPPAFPWPANPLGPGAPLYENVTDVACYVDTYEEGAQLALVLQTLLPVEGFLLIDQGPWRAIPPWQRHVPVSLGRPPALSGEVNITGVLEQGQAQVRMVDGGCDVALTPNPLHGVYAPTVYALPPLPGTPPISPGPPCAFARVALGPLCNSMPPGVCC